MLGWPAPSVAAEVFLVNLAMSGENAVALAVVLVGLPRRGRHRILLLATTLCTVARLALATTLTLLLVVPGLRLLAGLLLGWVGIRLVLDIGGEAEAEALRPRRVAGVLGAILVTDTLTSLDNVLAMTAAAKGDLSSLALGLALGLPPLLWGAAWISRVVARLPWLVWAVAAFLTWTGVALAVTDPWLLARVPGVEDGRGLVAAVAVGLVLATSWWWRRVRGGEESAPGS